MIKRLLQKFNKAKVDEAIIIVSGLPRSGTSLMMKILDAGGLPVLTDHIRTADPDNPQGYYELERAKKLAQGDVAWLAEARGQVVKVLAILLFDLPATHTYRVIFMQRAMPEILASQRKMLINRGEASDTVSDEEMAQLFENYFRQARQWLERQPNIDYIEVDYNQLVQNPRPTIKQVNRFLGNGLDVASMVGVVDPSLYRQRH